MTVTSARVLETVRRHWLLTPLGTGALLLGALAWAAATRLEWVELATTAAMLLLVTAVAALLTAGRQGLGVEIGVSPPRVVAGETMYAVVRARNDGTRRHRAVRLELPVRDRTRDGEPERVAAVPVPTLPAGEAVEEHVRIPTTHRGVIEVGPSRLVRADPLGLARRDVRIGGVERLHVHPVTTRLEPLGAGWIRDLEGRSSDSLSNSDLAFHALREYVPGDDLRHVHWRSSARVASTSAASTLLVRQYVDTRRSRLAVVVSADRGEYADPEEFELAVSAAGSLALRALADGQGLSLVVGRHEIACPNPTRMLDGLAEVRLAGGREGMPHALTTARRTAADASVAFLLTGTAAAPARVRAAAASLGADVRTVVVRAGSGTPTDPGRTGAGSPGLLRLTTLDDLRRHLRRDLAG